MRHAKPAAIGNRYAAFSTAAGVGLAQCLKRVRLACRVPLILERTQRVSRLAVVVEREGLEPSTPAL